MFKVKFTINAISFFSSSVVSLIIYLEIILIYRKVARREQRLPLLLPNCYVLLHVLLPTCCISSPIFFFLKNSIYFWLRWVFAAAHKLSLVVVSGGYPLVVVCRLLIVVVSLVAEHTR